MLTDKQVRTARPKPKSYKITDRNSLFLNVSTKCHRTFRYKYRFDGKEQLLVIGASLDVRLAQARETMESARRSKAVLNQKSGGWESLLSTRPR